MPEKNNARELQKIKCFLLDMDGTIYLDDTLLPGAQEFLQLLQEKHIDYLFLTNNSSKSAAQYVKKLKSLGIFVSSKMILTSGEATAIYLRDHYPHASLYVVGTSALQDVFRNYDFTLVDQDPDIVVIGFDTTITYEKIWKCCDFVRAGLPYIATHPDINCPTEDGFMPDIGSFIAMIYTSTGRNPDSIIGKPHPAMVDAIEMRTGYPKNEICMIGDRLYTDVALGRAGIKTILVLSGEAKIEDVPDAEVKPDYVMKDLSEVVRILQKN